MGEETGGPGVAGGDEIELDLAGALGATEVTSTQVLTVYLPDRDREGEEVPEYERWVREAAALLARIGGGVTQMPPSRGGWLDPEVETIVWEETVQVWTYVIPERLVETLVELRGFLHRFGRETRQGEVAVEFDGRFFRITDYDR